MRGKSLLLYIVFRCDDFFVVKKYILRTTQYKNGSRFDHSEIRIWIRTCNPGAKYLF